ncbi:MAG: hypothetical protein HC846_10310, partial [Blastocatellia bacterium]|nr:hypothetical protein [Blastocatellia bacterium]
MQKSVNAVKMGGHIAVIGVLSGKGDGINPVNVLSKLVKCTEFSSARGRCLTI